MARPGDGAGDGRAVLVARRQGRRLVGEPLFERGPSRQFAKAKRKPGEGELLLCVDEGRGAKPIAMLGRAELARDVVAALLAHRGLRPTFPKRLEGEARDAIAGLERDPGPRQDLTSLPTFTVDPASARDFDDAVSARREGDGVRLWIHIADVAAHVQPGSGLDREARERANSTYVPGMVCPMLPRALSDDACSLNPGVERLAVTAEIELGPDAKVRSSAFYRSRIRSDHRLDYDQLDRFFAGSERPPGGIAEPLELARGIAAGLGKQAGGGGLTVSGSEPEFEFDSEGHVTGAQEVPQTESHRLIERLMVLTNEQVARLLERKGVPALYRIHEPPDPTRIEQLLEQLAALDLPTPAMPDDLGPTGAGSLAVEASAMVAAEAERRGHGAVPWSSLVLRALKQAVYSDENKGHAGLALSAYTHFTSPIRRYPDLIVHRALLATLGAGEHAPERHEVIGMAEHCSTTERDSMKIERSGDDICLGFLLERELSERGPDRRFEGEVAGVVGAGAFVRFGGEMADTYEGFLPARRIRGDRYELDETGSALVGIQSGARFGIGDPVSIKVDSVEAPRGRVDLIPADAERRAPRKGRAKAKAKGEVKGRSREGGARQGGGGRRSRRRG